MNMQTEIYKTLEKKFAKFAGKEYAVALSSGTAALHLALLALGVGPGDEVIVPDFTFVACAFAVSYTGATPIFVDCADDLNINVDLIEAKITSKTKVIMGVHIYGRKCNMDKIIEIARTHNLKTIEDISEAPGLKLSDANIAVYSLQSSKVINCEEGGILVTNSVEIYEEVSEMKTFYNSGSYFHPKLSFNYRMPARQAQMALTSLGLFEDNCNKRRSKAGTIKKEIEKTNLNVVELPFEVPWVLALVCKTEKYRDHLIEVGRKEGGRVRPFFKPMTTLPMYNNQETGPVALYYSQRGFIVPLSK